MTEPLAMGRHATALTVAVALHAGLAVVHLWVPHGESAEATEPLPITFMAAEMPVQPPPPSEPPPVEPEVEEAPEEPPPEVEDPPEPPPVKPKPKPATKASAAPDPSPSPEPPPEASAPSKPPGGGPVGGAAGNEAEGGVAVPAPADKGPGYGSGGQGALGPGKGKSFGKADLVRYAKGIYGKVSKEQRYPASARSLGLEGKVVVKLTVNRNGKLVGAPTVAKSCGHKVLDDEALRMVKAGAPYTALPVEFSKDTLTTKIPVVFKLKSP